MQKDIEFFKNKTVANFSDDVLRIFNADKLSLVDKMLKLKEVENNLLIYIGVNFINKENPDVKLVLSNVNTTMLEIYKDMSQAERDNLTKIVKEYPSSNIKIEIENIIEERKWQHRKNLLEEIAHENDYTVYRANQVSRLISDIFNITRRTATGILQKRMKYKDIIELANLFELDAWYKLLSDNDKEICRQLLATARNKCFEEYIKEIQKGKSILTHIIPAYRKIAFPKKNLTR